MSQTGIAGGGASSVMSCETDVSKINVPSTKEVFLSRKVRNQHLNHFSYAIIRISKLTISFGKLYGCQQVNNKVFCFENCNYLWFL